MMLLRNKIGNAPDVSSRSNKSAWNKNSMVILTLVSYSIFFAKPNIESKNDEPIVMKAMITENATKGWNPKSRWSFNFSTDLDVESGIWKESIQYDCNNLSIVKRVLQSIIFKTGRGWTWTWFNISLVFSCLHKLPKGSPPSGPLFFKKRSNHPGY